MEQSLHNAEDPTSAMAEAIDGGSDMDYEGCATVHSQKGAETEFSVRV